MHNQKAIRVAIFASGTGSNALNICKYFKNTASIDIVTLVCNKPKAKVIENIKPFNLQLVLINRDDFKKPEKFIGILKEQEINLIVLAGFLWLIPVKLIEAFPNKIINLHPALLPKYGGKGMYGSKVHEAVIANKEPESGITIHFVNELYDDGAVIFQVSTKLEASETPVSLANKIHQLEYKHFPIVIEKLLLKQ